MSDFYTALFKEIGLSPNEAKIYEALLESGETNVSSISSRAKIHRRNVYDALNRLVDKGLVFQVFDKTENLFEPVHPEKLMELVKEKEQKLENAMPDLNEMFSAEPAKEAAYIYRGIEGFKNYMRDLLRVGEEVYFLGAKALWYTPGVGKSFLTNFKRDFDKKKIPYKTLYDPRVPEKMPEALGHVGGNYKVLPKGYDTIGVTDIFGDRIVSFTSIDVGNFGRDGTIFVIINKQLADSYKTWFRLMWDLLPEEKKPKKK